MSAKSISVEHVAVLLRSLDLESRSAIVQRMPTPIQHEINAALRSKSTEDDQETQLITREFVHRLRLAQLQRDNSAPNRADSAPKFACDPAGEFDALLDRAPESTMQQLMASENPQTVAVIIAHLSPDRAASLLQLTTSERRSAILQRVIELEDSDPHAVQDIRNYLAATVGRKLEDHNKSMVRLSRVKAIFGAADPRLKAEIRRLMDGQVTDQTRSRSTATRPSASVIPDAAGTSVRFDRIVDVPDEVVNKIFRSIPADVAAVALAGASQPARKDLLQRLPPNVRAQIDSQTSRLGPTRVADIQLAQQIVLSLIEKLLNDSAVPRDVRVTLSA